MLALIALLLADRHAATKRILRGGAVHPLPARARHGRPGDPALRQPAADSPVVAAPAACACLLGVSAGGVERDRACVAGRCTRGDTAVDGAQVGDHADCDGHRRTDRRAAVAGRRNRARDRRRGRGGRGTAVPAGWNPRIERAQGFALGIAAHGFGTAHALMIRHARRRVRRAGAWHGGAVDGFPVAPGQYGCSRGEDGTDDDDTDLQRTDSAPRAAGVRALDVPAASGVRFTRCCCSTTASGRPVG
jgi:hypothetical protein